MASSIPPRTASAFPRFGCWSRTRIVSGDRQRACVSVSRVASVLPSFTNRNSTQCPFARNWVKAPVFRRCASLKHGTTTTVCGKRGGGGPELTCCAVGPGTRTTKRGSAGMCRDESLRSGKATRLVGSGYVRYASRVGNRRPLPVVVQAQLPIEESRQASAALPTIGEQKDIRYHAARARGLLNGPESTGMGYWSINPYVGCAFGCTYCYARYAHRYALDRALSSSSGDADLRADVESMPPWLAFERHVLVKENAPTLLAQELRPGSARLAALTSGDVVVIGTATDPYQPAERRFRITRGVLSTLVAHSGLSIVII